MQGITDILTIGLDNASSNFPTKLGFLGEVRLDTLGCYLLLHPTRHASLHDRSSNKVAFSSWISNPQGLVFGNNPIVALLRRLNKCKS